MLKDVFWNEPWLGDGFFMHIDLSLAMTTECIYGVVKIR